MAVPVAMAVAVAIAVAMAMTMALACLHLRRCRYPSGNEHAFTIQVLRPVGSAVGNAILGRQMEQP